MDLEKTTTDILKNIVDSGFIESSIKEQLEKTIKSTVNSLLSNYSEFSIQLEEKLKKAFNLNLDSITLMEYNSLMMNYITDELKLYMENDMQPVMAKKIKEFFKPLEKDEYKLSEIITEYKNYIKEQNLDNYDRFSEGKEITIIIEDGMSDDYIELYLSEEDNQDKHSCDFHIRINKTGIWDITSSDCGKNKKAKLSCMFGFDRYMFQMYSQNINIIIDKTNFDNYIYGDAE